MYEITKIIEYAYGHRLMFHPKCANLHGHNARVMITLRGQTNDQDMLMDFGVLHTAMRHVAELFDHSMVISEEDKDALRVFKNGASVVVPEAYGDYLGKRWRHPVLGIVQEVQGHPTAEFFAGLWFTILRYELQTMKVPDTIKVARVEFWETSTAKAVYAASY